MNNWIIDNAASVMGIYYKKNFTYKIKKNIHTPQVFKNLDFSSPFFFTSVTQQTWTKLTILNKKLTIQHTFFSNLF